MSPVKYLFRCLLLSAAVCLIIPVFSSAAGFRRPSFLYEIGVLFAFWNALLYKLFFSSTNKETFVPRYMTTLVIKFTTALLFMFAFGLADRDGIVPNTLFIAFNYLIFLVLEISVLYRRVNQEK